MATKVAMISCLMMLARMTMVTSEKPETPSITKPDKEKDIYVQLGSSATIECEATGYPAPKYKWYYSTQDDVGSPVTNINPPGGQASYDETSGELLIQSMGKNMEGYYNCHATTVFTSISHATALSPNVKISVPSLNPVKRPSSLPTTVTVPAGQYVMLPCVDAPESSGPAEFGWYQSLEQNVLIQLDERQFIDDKGNLHFAYVKREDQNVSYVCGLDSKVARQTLYGGIVKLKVTQPSTAGVTQTPELKFPLDPRNMTTFELGQTGKLSCFYSAYGNENLPVISWKDKNRNTITAGNGYKLDDNRWTLVIDPVKEEHEGSFFCQPNVGEGVELNVKVISPPVPVKTLKAQKVVEEKDAHLYCDMRSLKGENPPEKPKWMRNGSPMRTNDNFRKNDFSIDLKTLTIKDVDKADTSCYQCSVKNSVGRTISSGCLYVVSAIWVYKKPEAVYFISRGDVVNFTVSAESDPDFRLKYAWVFRNKSYMDGLPHVVSSISSGIAYMNTSNFTDRRMKEVTGLYQRILYNGVETVTVEWMVKLKEDRDLFEFPYWIIGLILAILLLLIIIIICCCVYCRRKMQAGDYPVDRRETAAGLDPGTEVRESAFPALSRAIDPDEKKKKGSHLNIDDDYSIRDDSFGSTDYGEDGPTAFNEDGSFIGIYKNNLGYQNSPRPPHQDGPMYKPGSESNV